MRGNGGAPHGRLSPALAGRGARGWGIGAGAGEQTDAPLLVPLVQKALAVAARSAVVDLQHRVAAVRHPLRHRVEAPPIPRPRPSVDQQHERRRRVAVGAREVCHELQPTLGKSRVISANLASSRGRRDELERPSRAVMRTSSIFANLYSSSAGCDTKSGDTVPPASLSYTAYSVGPSSRRKATILRGRCWHARIRLPPLGSSAPLCCQVWGERGGERWGGLALLGATSQVCSSRVREAMLTSAPPGAAASSALKSASSSLSKKRRSVRA